MIPLRPGKDPKLYFFTRGRLRPVKANTLLKYSNSPSASRPMPCPNDIEFGSQSQLALSEFLRTEKTRRSFRGPYDCAAEVCPEECETRAEIN
jgi:hypothetical protein